VLRWGNVRPSGIDGKKRAYRWQAFQKVIKKGELKEEKVGRPEKENHFEKGE